MSIIISAEVSEVRCHGATRLFAEATKLADVAWLTIYMQRGVKDHSVVYFMPYETALAYASAINTVNDRKTIEKSDLEPSHEEQTMSELSSKEDTNRYEEHQRNAR